MKRPQLNIRMDDEFYAAIDDIRSLTRPVPSISDAVRTAVFEWRDTLKRKTEAQERRK